MFVHFNLNICSITLDATPNTQESAHLKQLINKRIIDFTEMYL